MDHLVAVKALGWGMFAALWLLHASDLEACVAELPACVAATASSRMACDFVV